MPKKRSATTFEQYLSAIAAHLKPMQKYAGIVYEFRRIDDQVKDLEMHLLPDMPLERDRSVKEATLDSVRKHRDKISQIITDADIDQTLKQKLIDEFEIKYLAIITKIETLELRDPEYISPHSVDASQDTKLATFIQEIVDAIQVATMTVLEEVVQKEIGGDFEFHIGELPSQVKDHISLSKTLDLAPAFNSMAYGLLGWLDYDRYKKYRQRNSLMKDNNSSDYYSMQADAIFEALSDAQKQILLKNLDVLGFSAGNDESNAEQETKFIKTQIINIIRRDTNAFIQGTNKKQETVLDRYSHLYTGKKTPTLDRLLKNGMKFLMELE